MTQLQPRICSETFPRSASRIGSVVVSSFLLSFLFWLPSAAAQTKPVKTGAANTKTKQSRTAKPAQTKPVDELTRLRQEFIKATNEYKDLLKKQLAGLEKNVTMADERLAQSQKLFADGLISRKELEASERGVAEAKDKITDLNRRMANADSQIADTLVEAEAETKIAKSKPVPRGGTINTASFIRYNGAAVWVLSDAWKVQRFFLDSFKKPLPVAVFGQGAIHDRWRLDHHNAMDVSLHPDGPEGQALLGYLRANGIPFLAFRGAIPGTATGPHIHIGRPSHRY
jgi:hypothetical protein